MTALFGPAAALGSAALWAWASARYARSSGVIGSSAVNLVRGLIVLPLFALGTVVTGFTTAGPVPPTRFGWLFMSAICSYAVADNFFFAAARRIGTSTALAIASSYPLWAALVGVLFLGERSGPLRLAGAALCVCGVAALILLGSSRTRETTEHARGGLVLAFLTSALWAGNTVSVKLGSAGLTTMGANLVRYLCALPIVAIGSRLLPGRAGIRASGEWRNLIAVSIFEAFFSSALFVYALGHTDLAVGATLSSLAPLIAVPVTIAMGEERWSVKRFAAVTATVVGVILLVVGA